MKKKFDFNFWEFLYGCFFPLGVFVGLGLFIGFFGGWFFSVFLFAVGLFISYFGISGYYDSYKDYLINEKDLLEDTIEGIRYIIKPNKENNFGEICKIELVKKKAKEINLTVPKEVDGVIIEKINLFIKNYNSEAIVKNLIIPESGKVLSISTKFLSIEKLVISKSMEDIILNEVVRIKDIILDEENKSLKLIDDVLYNYDESKVLLVSAKNKDKKDLSFLKKDAKLAKNCLPYLLKIKFERLGKIHPFVYYPHYNKAFNFNFGVDPKYCILTVRYKEKGKDVIRDFYYLNDPSNIVPKSTVVSLDFFNMSLGGVLDVKIYDHENVPDEIENMGRVIRICENKIYQNNEIIDKPRPRLPYRISVNEKIQQYLQDLERDNKNQRYRYISHCWYCKSRIDSEINQYCPVCGYYKCSFCGHCFCPEV